MFSWTRLSPIEQYLAKHWESNHRSINILLSLIIINLDNKSLGAEPLLSITLDYQKGKSNPRLIFDGMRTQMGWGDRVQEWPGLGRLE
jgi:hypothetical protein